MRNFRPDVYIYAKLDDAARERPPDIYIFRAELCAASDRVYSTYARVIVQRGEPPVYTAKLFDFGEKMLELVTLEESGLTVICVCFSSIFELFALFAT